MIKITAGKLADIAGGTLLHPEDTDIQIHGVSIDSRQVTEGSLYVPLIGARADGHTFIDMVKEKGAAATLWNTDHTPYPQDIPVILTQDSLAALQSAATAYLKQLAPYTIGITGSNGKTSVKDMMAAAFATQSSTAATPGNRNSDIGLPLTIMEFEPGLETAILEMGMENFGEIAKLVSIAPLDAAVITSIGSAHMANLGSRQHIAQAKCEILKGLKPGGLFLYNEDTPEVAIELAKPDNQQFIQENDIQVIPFGEKQIHNVRLTGGHMEFDSPFGPVTLNALGSFQCVNALPVLWLAARKGLDMDKVKAALASVHLTGMRANLRPAGKAAILDDSYKSNPESAKAALDILASLPGRKAAVLADMLDLGDNQQALHQEVLDYAARLHIPVYATGPVFAKTDADWYEDKEALFEAVKPLLENDTVILVKGSRFFKMDELADKLEKEGNMKTKPITLAVLFGGQSSEYSVSLHSAASMLRSLHKDRYDLKLIGITQDGEFLEYEGSIDDLEHDHWQDKGRPIWWTHGGYVSSKDPENVVKVDVAFPVLHGKNGEDGTLQGLMEVLNIHCVGCDTRSSADIMDKETTHILLDAQDVPTAPYVCLRENRPNPSFEQIEAKIPLPWIVKPCNAGSSYGVHKVKSREEFEPALQDAFHFDGRGKALVEQCIDGFEIGCAVMGNEDVFAGSVDEIQLAGDFFDFDGKYAMNGAAIYCPARLPEADFQKARKLAMKAYKAMDCTGFTRVDMFYQPDGTILVNELNTIPGMTATSRYPTMMAKAGIPFDQLLDKLVDLALEKKVGQR